MACPEEATDSHLRARACDGLVSCPGGGRGSHPLNTTETGNKGRPNEPFGAELKEFSIAILFIRLRPVHHTSMLSFENKISVIRLHACTMDDIL